MSSSEVYSPNKNNQDAIQDAVENSVQDGLNDANAAGATVKPGGEAPGTVAGNHGGEAPGTVAGNLGGEAPGNVADDNGSEFVADIGEQEGVDPEEKSFSMEDFMAELDKYKKAEGEKAVSEYMKDHPAPTKNANLTEEERKKIEKKERRQRRFAKAMDIFKDLANAFAVTQGVGSRNWGMNATNEIDARKEKERNEYKELMDKYSEQLKAIRNNAEKEARSNYLEYRKQRQAQGKADDAKAKADKAEEEKQRKEEEARKREARSRASSNAKNPNAPLPSMRELTDIGFSQNEARSIIETHKEAKAAAKRKENREIQRMNKETSKKPTNTIKLMIDGKEKVYEGGDEAIDKAHEEIMSRQGKKPKKDQSREQKIHDINEYIRSNGGDFSFNEIPMSLRERFLVKQNSRKKDGSDPNDWA